MIFSLRTAQFGVAFTLQKGSRTINTYKDTGCSILKHKVILKGGDDLCGSVSTCYHCKDQHILARNQAHTALADPPSVRTESQISALIFRIQPNYLQVQPNYLQLQLSVFLGWKSETSCISLIAAPTGKTIQALQ